MVQNPKCYQHTSLSRKLSNFSKAPTVIFFKSCNNENNSSVKNFSSSRLKFSEKNNIQCMEKLSQTTGQIQGKVQP